MTGKNKTIKGGDETLLNKKVIMNVLQSIQRSLHVTSDFEQKKQKIKTFQKFIEKYENNPFLQEPEIQNLISSISNNAQESIYEKIERFKSMNSKQKNANYSRILQELKDTYRYKPEYYNLAKLSRLASIGSSIESINRIKNSNNKNILVRALKNTIQQRQNSLKEYPEFEQYKSKI